MDPHITGTDEIVWCAGELITPRFDEGAYFDLFAARAANRIREEMFSRYNYLGHDSTVPDCFRHEYTLSMDIRDHYML